MLRDTRAGYGLLTILLHWISALLIIFLFGLGVYMVDLGYYDPWYHRAPALHISIGLVLLILMLARVLWRLFSAQPAPLPSHSPLTRMLARGMKYLLYLCVAVMIVTGYLVTTADGKPASLFGWLDFPATVRLGPTGVDRAGLIHEIVAWILILSAALHALAALIHHFKIRDRTLIRMLKPVKKMPAAQQSTAAVDPH